MTPETRTILDALEEHGILLEHDSVLPSATRLVAGEPVRGSWWAHPAGKRVYHALLAIDDHTAIATRLVAGKVTLVHRSVFPQVLAIALESAPWQTRELSAEARALLDRVRTEGPISGAGKAGLELERRLLVLGRSEHTDRGSHAKVIETFDAWAARESIEPARADRARADLESRVARWGGDPARLLPWTARR